MVEPDRVGLLRLLDLVALGRLRIHVTRTFPLSEAAVAHQVGEAGRTLGKTVLIVG